MREKKKKSRLDMFFQSKTPWEDPGWILDIQGGMRFWESQSILVVALERSKKLRLLTQAVLEATEAEAKQVLVAKK